MRTISDMARPAVGSNYGDSAFKSSASFAIALGLRPALTRFERTSDASLDGAKEAITAGRPANALGGAQAVKQIRLRLAGKWVGGFPRRGIALRVKHAKAACQVCRDRPEKTLGRNASGEPY
jgi:hypothetical protein